MLGEKGPALATSATLIFLARIIVVKANLFVLSRKLPRSKVKGQSCEREGNVLKQRSLS